MIWTKPFVIGSVPFSFFGKSRFVTWANRVAINHLFGHLRPMRTTSFYSGARPEQTGGPIRRSATRIRARFPPGTPRVSTSEPELVVINLVS
jgi:hypothetical protein